MRLLSDSMSPSHRLQVILWIPIALFEVSIELNGGTKAEGTNIEDDDCVGSFQIDSKSTGACAQQECKIRAPRRIEMGYTLLPGITANHSIQSLMCPHSQIHVVTENIEHPDHLAKDQHAMAVLAKSSEELVEQHHLARVHDETLESLICGLGPDLCAVEKIRMIGGFLEFHG